MTGSDTALVSLIREEPKKGYLLANMTCSYHKPVLLLTVYC